jgi:thiol-disulfide isomerase/thioredoxin
MTAVIVVLACLCLVNFMMTLALAKRLRALVEVVNNNGIQRDPNLPTPGDKARPFESRTIDGELVSDAILKEGTALVGFFAPGCTKCVNVRAELLENPPSIPMYAFVDATNGEAEALEIARSLRPIAKAAVTRAGDPATLAFRDAGYPTLLKVVHGKVTASGHSPREIQL